MSEVPNTNQPKGFLGDIVTTIQAVAPLWLNYRQGRDPGSNAPAEWNTSGYLFGPVADNIPSRASSVITDRGRDLFVTNRNTLIGVGMFAALVGLIFVWKK